LWTLDSQIAKLRDTRTKAEKAAKESTKPIKDAETLDAFAAGDVTWLDELSRLSQKLPPPEQVQIAELTAQVVPKAGGGQIKFVGYADTSQRVADVEDALRDEKHNVSGKGLTPDPEEEFLPWTFDETLVILPPAGAAAAAKKAPAKPAPVAAKQGGTK
jgi:hypothetical protein